MKINHEERGDHAGIWVLGEIAGGRLAPVTRELLGCATALAAARPQPVWAVLWGDEPERFAAELIAAGADRVLLVKHPGLAVFHEESQARLLQHLIEKYRPEIVLAGATARGRALTPRAAALCHAGLTADCTGLEIDPASGALFQTRPAFGGSLMATIRSDRFMPQLATVRPGVMAALASPRTAGGEVIFESWRPDPALAALKTVLAELRETDPGEAFDHCRVLITGGRGMNGPEGFRKLEKLAALTGGAVGATRAAVDAGWVAYGRQIGQTGRTVQSKLYLGCGVSGQIQHLVGIQSSDLIVAINSDPAAPLMDLADIALVGDAAAVVDALIEQLQTQA